MSWVVRVMWYRIERKFEFTYNFFKAPQAEIFLLTSGSFKKMQCFRSFCVLQIQHFFQFESTTFSAWKHHFSGSPKVVLSAQLESTTFQSPQKWYFQLSLKAPLFKSGAFGLKVPLFHDFRLRTMVRSALISEFQKWYFRFESTTFSRFSLAHHFPWQSTLKKGMSYRLPIDIF